MRVLVHPWFTGAVMVLAVNDHVLKGRGPALLTGKLSDVAGVVAVAVLAAVLGGRRSGVGLTAAAFVALKVVPGVAEAVAPVLGGVTRRDPTDLVALLALVPLDRWLRSALPPERHLVARGGALGTAVGALAVATSMMATAATSCLEPPPIESVAVDDGVLIAAAGSVTWRSDDGGADWSIADVESPAVQREACDGDACYRVEPGAGLERCAGDDCTVAYRFSGEQRRRMELQAECGWDVDDDFLAVAAGEGLAGEATVLVAMGGQGVLVGQAGGQLERVAVSDSRPLDIHGLPSWTRRLLIAPVVLFFAGPLLLLLGRRRMTWAGAATALAMGSAAFLVGAIVWSGFSGADPRLTGVVVAALSVVVFAASLVLLITRPRKQWLPPPPLPPPPGPLR